MKKILIITIVAISSWAKADLLEVRGYISDDDVLYADQAYDFQGYQGVVALWTVNNVTAGGNFLAFCAEQSQSVDYRNNWNFTISPYTTVS